MRTSPGKDETNGFPAVSCFHWGSSTMIRRPTVLRFLLAKDRCLNVFIASEMKVLPSLASTHARAAYSFRE